MMTRATPPAARTACRRVMISLGSGSSGAVTLSFSRSRMSLIITARPPVRTVARVAATISTAVGVVFAASDPAGTMIAIQMLTRIIHQAPSTRSSEVFALRLIL